ncbi:MAG: hypothetical protein ABSC53_00355 [Bacteroidota bacterium]
MNTYKEIREELFRSQNLNQLISKNYNMIAVLTRKRLIHELPEGFNGVTRYYRIKGSLICEAEFRRGTVYGCARYYSDDGKLVGQDYYENGGVI